MSKVVAVFFVKTYNVTFLCVKKRYDVNGILRLHPTVRGIILFENAQLSRKMSLNEQSLRYCNIQTVKLSSFLVLHHPKLILCPYFVSNNYFNMRTPITKSINLCKCYNKSHSFTLNPTKQKIYRR